MSESAGPLGGESATAAPAAATVPGRVCGDCTLCCKLLPVAALDKPRFEWCRHCDKGRGCGIYDDRPDACRTFACSYLVSPGLGDEWRPSVARFFLTFEEEANRLGVHVDPGRKDAWRAEPYFTQIRRWAATAAAAGEGQVVVWEGPVAIVILPGIEKKLGRVPAGHVIVTARRRGPLGIEYNAIAIPPDDPRLKRNKPAD
ncbi:MAG: hypothetical protein O2905_05725 [Proteobacteria bacterium]|nr:hypothetical protein [Pseudomonadota bacterium]MDA1132703.1 hypothetical protein [Pseudomonadota bacterium]